MTGALTARRANLMKILLTGASGLIGSALAPFLASEGHEIIKLKRATELMDCRQRSWDPEAGKIALADGGPFEAVIHLAGETIAQRWTAAAKLRIRDSRINGTRLLSEALVRFPQPPKLFICASATGYYGNRGDELLDEQSSPGRDFLAEVCREWEAAAQSVAEHGARVVNLRFGIVLASQGGALRKMLPAFRFGVGGKLGDGRQYWSWIAIDDLLSVIRHVLRNDALRGPVNVVSPQPVTNGEFTRTLGSVLRRPTLFRVPDLAVRFLFGEMGEAALLASCRALPSRLEHSGFAFQFPTLKAALSHLVFLK